MTDWILRAGTRDDVADLAAIERAADSLFPAGRLPPGDDTYSLASLWMACDEGLLFVVEAEARTAGFAVCTVVEGRLHLAGLAVHPEVGRRGLGARLVTRVIEEARLRDLAGVTLTTFADLPWNAPFYERFGFKVVDADACSPCLAEVLRREQTAGMTHRVAMICAMNRAQPPV
jgi:predicted N-acetyltransferase YhbS